MSEHRSKRPSLRRFRRWLPQAKDATASPIPDSLTLPTGMLGGTPFFSLRGREELELCGCAGLQRYETDCIAMRLTDGGSLTVIGSSLCLRAYQRCRLTVRGKIDRLEFAP